MGKQFEFADFIDEFKVNFKIYKSQDGFYNDAGKWIEIVPGDPVEMVGIILPASSTFNGSNKLNYEDNGVYTENAVKIYTTQPLGLGDVVEYDNKTYTIDSEKPYQAYADVYIYYAKGDKS